MKTTPIRQASIMQTAEFNSANAQMLHIAILTSEQYTSSTTYTGFICSWNTITDENGNLLQELSFDAWGNRRDPATWRAFTGTAPEPLFDRGFTGHEHLYAFALINMNGRFYDPVLGRMLSPDPYMQAPDFSQSFNRYSYCLNNPLVYTDPSGEFIFTTLAAIFCPPLVPAAIYVDFFTEFGYDMQKMTSPVALHISTPIGTHQRGIGIDVSVGVHLVYPVSYRVHGGISYYWKNYNITPGWETRYGAEWGFYGVLTVGGTHYNSPGTKFDQTTNHFMLGVPLFNAKYENDWFFDLNIPLIPHVDPAGSDKYRTSGTKINMGLVDIGINLFTGDPGSDVNRIVNPFLGGKAGQYEIGANGENPDEFRAGVGYVGIGPFRFGNDRESRRNKIQNKMVHGDKYAWFKYMDVPNKFYFQFGSGGGYLW